MAAVNFYRPTPPYLLLKLCRLTVADTYVLSGVLERVYETVAHMLRFQSFGVQ
jgi:hypothetical protein